MTEGKGGGLNILLHGSPRVGKRTRPVRLNVLSKIVGGVLLTSLAECIAEYTERPLLWLTFSDIGG